MTDNYKLISEDKDGNGVYIDKGGNTVYMNKNMEFHNINGPAIKFVDGSEMWYVNNKLHRLDGPAIKLSNGTKSWYVRGDCLTTTYEYPVSHYKDTHPSGIR